MNYHFKLHKEILGYWAECCELDGCNTEGDSLEEVQKACEEALDVYLYEPDNSERIIPLPDEALDGKRGIIKIMADPQRAFAILLKNHRLNAHMTQKQVSEMLGMKNIYSYQRLEKKSNPSLSMINKIHTKFPEIKLEYLFM
jgi:predicted RNase H-like HicB family nuclease/DNA-binding XRE family transcriptional regulator